VEKDPQAKQASMQHVMMLQQRYPHLLPHSIWFNASGCCFNWFRWMWTNLTPLEVIQQTYEFIPRSPTCLVMTY
jgi:hypothetical protein